MTMSMEIVKNMINSNDNFSKENVLFILTVIRDNCMDDDIYNYINEIVKGDSNE